MSNMLKNLHATVKNITPYPNYEAYISDILAVYQNMFSKITDPFLNEEKVKEQLEITADKSCYPLIQLQNKFQLSDFQIHCLLCGLLHHNQPNLFKILGNVGEKVLMPDLEYAYSIYSQKNKVNFADIHQEMNEDFINTFFETKNNGKENHWKTLVTLNQDSANFLMNKNIFPTINDETQAAQGECYKLFPQPKTEEFDHDNQISTDIQSILQRSKDNNVIHIYGKELSGRLYQIRQALGKSDKKAILFSAEKLKYIKENQQNNLLYEVLRLGKFYDAVPVITDASDLCGNAYAPFAQLAYKIFHFFTKHFGKVFFISDQLHFETLGLPNNLKFTHYEVKLPNHDEQLEIWQKSLAQVNNLAPNIDINEICNRYDFATGQIKKSIANSQLHALQLGKQTLDQEALNTGCRQSCSTLQASGTHIVNCKYGWDDIILSPWQKMSLQHACDYISLKHVVYKDWNFQKSHQYGNNLSVLMEGPPGTGKTMAAQVLAKELNMPLYKVDIAETVSKYIGESEKKLKVIFDEAEKSNAILFIDEMESFFSKRTQVQDSHDKYANMETSFLLQKVESYQGILLLATNHLEMIDEAFIRRIKFIINFAMPDEKQRLKLWQNMFIPTAPLGTSVDLPFLAKHLEVSGGTIKNMVLKSAFLAAAQNSHIEMVHILTASKGELKKQGKILLNSDFGDYAFLLEN